MRFDFALALLSALNDTTQLISLTIPITELTTDDQACVLIFSWPKLFSGMDLATRPPYETVDFKALAKQDKDFNTL